MPSSNERYHDRIAARYDDVYKKDAYWAYYHEVSWQDLKPSLPRDLSRPVLDVGCGTGLFGLRLMKSGYTVVFSDLSRKMLDVALRKAGEQFPSREADAAVADITDLEPFEDERFSFVVAQGDPLSFSTDRRRAWRNLHRVLAPNGCAVVSVDSRFGGCQPFVGRNDLEGLEDFLAKGAGTWLADRAEERFPFHAFTPTSLRQEAERAGFDVVRVIGKTMFDLRGGHPWIDDLKTRRRLLAMEKRYGATELALGRAHHLQITVRKRDAEAPQRAEPRTERVRRGGRRRKKGAR
ncbi:MAG: hypothetical protein CMJ83_14435 [Planctomycetes bacterium]|nr:hypothetical protein [Planctomycetota bacterium]